MSNASQRVTKWYDHDAVLVFGHRGAKAYAPMNTLPAFELALKQGAQGVELDVHRSRDGYPVILHDYTIDSTTNGTGRITEMTLDEIKVLDAGSWFDPKFAGVQVPTLDEVFELLGHNMLINVEIKSEDIETDGVEQVVLDCINRHDMQDHVIVSSFNPNTLKRFRAIAPDIPIGYLYASDIPPMVAELMTGETYEAYHPHYSLADQAIVDTQKALGRVVNVWTVNDPDVAKKLVKLGVQGIISDCPDVILSALKGE